ncbi:MAG: serine hydrolase domain-containing protein [Actinomycetes bacterium]
MARRRRWWVIALAGVITVALVAAGAYLIARPRLSTSRTGDQDLLGALGSPAGFNELAAVLVERGRPARYAGIGADERRPFETGSNGKTMTGMLLADAVERGELALEDRLDRWVPEIAGSPVGQVTLASLATHTSGLPRDGAHSPLTLCWVIGTNCIGADEATLLADLTAALLATPGRVAYSNLGTGALGLALTRATAQPYPDLAERLLEPLGMLSTRVQTPQTGPLAPRGYQPWGIRPENWVMDAYQPVGGFVSTASDMGNYLRAVLEGTAPGMDATRQRVEAHDLPPVGSVRSAGVGLFWIVGTLDGRSVLLHTGETGGYRSAMIVDPERGRAAMVLSNVNKPVGGLTESVLRAP